MNTNMNFSEVIVFVIYLLFMLGIGVYFFLKSKGGGKRPTSSAAARWARGLRPCPPARPT